MPHTLGRGPEGREENSQGFALLTPGYYLVAAPRLKCKKYAAVKYPPAEPAEPEALWLRAPQKGLIATKAVNGYVYEHVHVNDHGFRRR